MSDTSLVFNLVARDRASATMDRMKERMATAGAAIGAGVATALGAGVMTHLNMEAASDKLAAQLGVGPAKAAELSKVSASVYKNAWGDSIETVNMAVRGVYQNIGDTSKAEGGLKGVTTKALALAQTFDQEVGPTTAAVGQMLKTGLADNADEAFDILTRGFQTGANKADDLLDTLNEYGTQWRKFGLDGETAMGLLSQGLKAGARDADVVADAIKEFSIRGIDGSESTAEGFKAVGLNASDMAAKIGKGGDTAAQALDVTLDRLRAIEDPVKREAAAVALFGTQAEDLGAALFALDPSKAVADLGKVGGAADKMTKQVGDNPQAALESFKRSAMVNLGEVAGQMAQFAMANKSWLIPLVSTLVTLAATIFMVNATAKAFTATSNAFAAVGRVADTAAGRVIKRWALAAARSVASMARIAATAVATAARTAAVWAASAARMMATWMVQIVRVAVRTAIQFALMAARAIAWAAVMAAQWLIAMGPIGWIILAVIALVALIILYWDQIKAATVAAWNWVWTKIKQFAGFIWKLFLNWTIVGRVIKHWDQIKAKTVAVWNTVVAWVKKIPGRLVSLFLNWTLAGRIIKHWDQAKRGAIRKGGELLSWARGLPGRITRGIGGLGGLLYGKGQDIVSGLVRGIRSMGAWLRQTLINWARNMIPGPIADALGISSPSKVLADEVGRWVPEGISMGITTNLDQVRAASRAAADAAVPSMTAKPVTTQQVRPLLMNGAMGQRIRVDINVSGADEDFKRMFRKIVRVDGGGSVQTAFGRG